MGPGDGDGASWRARAELSGPDTRGRTTSKRAPSPGRLRTPTRPPETIGETVVIGWNRSAQAARAVHAALPMLERDGDVVILSVETGAKRGPSAEQMARYLAWHEVKAEVREFAPDNRSVGEVLLAEAEAA